MKNQDRYNQILETVGAVFQEFCTRVESIKNDFAEENKQDPGLTMTIVEYNFEIVKMNNRAYQNRLTTKDTSTNDGRSLEDELKFSGQKLKVSTENLITHFYGLSDGIKKLFNYKNNYQDKSGNLIS
jgi:hypothetical protein